MNVGLWQERQELIMSSLQRLNANSLFDNFVNLINKIKYYKTVMYNFFGALQRHVWVKTWFKNVIVCGVYM